MLETDVLFMQAALEEARRAEAEGEVPVGAVVVNGKEIMGRGGNRSISQNDPTAHAEVLALRQAAHRISNYRLEGCTLYVTIEPCAMCAGAAVQARLARIVYGCEDPRYGAVRTLFRVADDNRLNHRIEITRGILEEECASQIRTFFQKKRESK
jgi:tRNA(Arg) A34 adenosine deaminase TadA